MEDSITWVKTWEQLYLDSPEAVDASKKHWYTVPGASKSGFYESELPDRNVQGWEVVMDEFIKTHTNGQNYTKRRQPSLGGLHLSFTMCQLAMSDWYAHMDLPTLAEKAEAFMEKRTDVAERRRIAEAKLKGHDALKEAYAKGLDAVYTLAGLTPAQVKIAQHLMADTPDEVISDLMGYHDPKTHEGKFRTVRARKAEIHKKLQALLKEKS